LGGGVLSPVAAEKNSWAACKAKRGGIKTCAPALGGLHLEAVPQSGRRKRGRK